MRKTTTFLVMLLFFFCSPCQGQTSQVSLDNPAGVFLSQPPSSQLPLEKVIDPDEYIVGPGDELTINLWGEFNLTHVLSVTPEGTILLPGVGSLYISGISLKDAKEQIKKEISQRYRDSEVTITLTDLRRFKVSVTGEVNSPGTYISFANERVSDIIGRAGGFKENSSQRNIRVKRQDGNELTADVLKFLIAGNNLRNPYVLDGDIIYVPLRENRVSACGIYGAVKSAGEYEYSPKDSLLDLIELAGGLNVDADLASAEIVRFEEDNRSTRSISLSLEDLILHKERDKNLHLRPDDRVLVKMIPEYREKKQVGIGGEVTYPGVYPIVEGKDKLTDLVGWAGGFTKNASLLGTEIIRGYNLNIPDPEFERLKKIPIADMSSTEYEYFKAKSRERAGRVACDFRRLFLDKSKSYDVLLKDGDMVNVPAESKMVNISGSIVNPGLVNYVPNQDYGYYIEKAGGFSYKARKGKIYIIKGTTGKWVKAKSAARLDQGDAIWVPERAEKDYWKFFKDTMMVLGNAATIYLVVKQATQ